MCFFEYLLYNGKGELFWYVCDIGIVVFVGDDI